MKNTIIIILLLAVLGLGYMVLKPKPLTTIVPPVPQSNTTVPTTQQQTSASAPTAAPTVQVKSTAVEPQYVTYARVPLLPSYIGAQQGWKPVFMRSTVPYSCIPGRTGMGIPTVTEEKIINGRTYCIQTNDEGTAGTIYYTYTYTTRDTTSPNNNGTLSTHFTLGFHDTDCTKFGTAQSISCYPDQSVWDVNAAVAGILK